MSAMTGPVPRRADGPATRRAPRLFTGSLCGGAEPRLDRLRRAERQTGTAIAAGWRRSMLDLVFLALGCALFGLMAGYVAACDRL